MQYGKDYEYEAPVKLLDKLLHSLPQSPDEQLVVVSQVLSLSVLFFFFLNSLSLLYKNGRNVLLLRFCLTFFPLFGYNLFKVLVADINIGYEDIVNTQVRIDTADSF